MLAARRAKIQEEFDEIASQKENIKVLTQQYEQRLQEIDTHARKKIQEGVATGNKISQEIQENAQSKAKEILQQASLEISGEIAKAKNQLKNEMVTLVIKITEQILKEKLDDENQKKLIGNFVQEASLK